MNNRVAFAIFFITFHFLTFTPSHFHTFTPSHFHIYLRLMQKALLFVCCMMALPLFGQLFPQLGGQRAGISALTFLKVDVSARSAALGGANVCLSGDAYSTFTNPASLAETEGTSVGLGNTFWVNGINYGYLSANTPTSAGHFGLSIGAFGSGAIPVRTEFQPGGTGQNFYAGYFSAGLTYSKKLTDLFRFGLTARYVREQLDNSGYKINVRDEGRQNSLLLRFGLHFEGRGTSQSRDEGRGTRDEIEGRRKAEFVLRHALLTPFRRSLPLGKGADGEC
jgi:hypothetical protein